MNVSVIDQLIAALLKKDKDEVSRLSGMIPHGFKALRVNTHIFLKETHVISLFFSIQYRGETHRFELKPYISMRRLGCHPRTKYTDRTVPVNMVVEIVCELMQTPEVLEAYAHLMRQCDQVAELTKQGTFIAPGVGHA